MKYRNKGLPLAIILSVILILSSCTPTSETVKDQNIPEQKLAWDEKDSEYIADTLISSSLFAEWNMNFSKSRKPIIVVGKIENNSDEEIDVSLLAKNMERSLINSGEVSFIASKEMREIIRADRKDQDDFTKTDKFIKYMKLLKADFFMSGTINSQVDSSVIPIQKKYELIVNIINTKNASVVWKGVQNITK